MALIARALKEYGHFKRYPLNIKKLMENNGIESILYLTGTNLNEYLDIKKKILMPFRLSILSKELLLPNNSYYKLLMKILTERKIKYDISDLIKIYLNQTYYLWFSMTVLNLIGRDKGITHSTPQEIGLVNMERKYMDKILNSRNI